MRQVFTPTYGVDYSVNGMPGVGDVRDSSWFLYVWGRTDVPISVKVGKVTVTGTTPLTLQINY